MAEKIEKKGVLTGEEISSLDSKCLADFLTSSIHMARVRSSSIGHKKALISPVLREEVISSISEEELFGGLREEGMVYSVGERELLIEPSGLRGLENRKFIISPFNPENLGVDGIDFTVGEVVYESDTILGEVSVKDLEERNLKKHKLLEGQRFVVSPGGVYYIMSKEKVGLPKNLDIFIDSKSTIGRLACICGDATIPASLKNSTSNLIAVVMPDFFPLKITAGKSRLFQGIFKYVGESGKYSHMTRGELLDTKQIEVVVGGKKKSIEKCLDEDKLALHVSTHKAYVSRRFSKEELEKIEPIDVDGENLNWRDYFEKVKGNSELILEPGRFYLLGTQEYLKFGKVCGRIDRALTGPLAGVWVQFAGIIHAGFYGEITLECKTDRRTVIKEGDLIGYVKVDKLFGGCKLDKLKQSYPDQKAPKLSKIFRAY